MSIAKILAAVIFVLCAGVTYFTWLKSHSKENIVAAKPIINEPVQKKEEVVVQKTALSSEEKAAFEPIVIKEEDPIDRVDRIEYLFKPYPPLLPIVETIVYSSKVDWLTGRPAYLGDYASYYQTSKHFISRSLKKTANYFAQAISNGAKFNVLRKDKEIQFHLVLDLSRLKMRFYYYDAGQGERVLLKTYKASAGKVEPSRASGYLTPYGQYRLGQEVAIYQEGAMGKFNNQPCEMITVFGKRWIPFEEEIAYCTAPAKGLGIHGVPWERDEQNNSMLECRDCICRYESSGCIRLLTEDMEEIFAIIITKPSFIHIVKDFADAKLPGREVNPIF